MAEDPTPPEDSQQQQQQQQEEDEQTQRQQQQQQQQQQQRQSMNTTKLVILAILGFCAIVLGSAVLTLQLHVLQERQKLIAEGRTFPTRKKTSKTKQTVTKKTSPQPINPIHGLSRPKTTIRNSRPLNRSDIFLATDNPHYPAAGGGSWKTVRDAYWRQAVAWLQDWDALLDASWPQHVRPTLVPEARQLLSRNTNTTTSDSLPSPSTVAQWGLEQAANAGHPMAQHYLANVYISGIWPSSLAQSPITPLVAEGEDAPPPLQVFDEWEPTALAGNPQLVKAYILWHTAAMGGNIEAAMSLAYRMAHTPYEEIPPDTTTTSTTTTTMGRDSDDSTSNGKTKQGSFKGKLKRPVAKNPNDEQCWQVLPYYEAAAHGVMDWLEASPNSRAKVIPPMDRHLLAQVFLHGGTSSQLDMSNKPDETDSAIQFYHLKATTTPWSARSFYSSSSDESKKLEEPTIDVHAANVLAQLYHYGARGVEQNLTKSLEYYEIAGINGHWESAGEAGLFYLWGMGVDQDVTRALELFQIGAPFGLEGCQRKHEQAVLQRKKAKEEEDHAWFDGRVNECDETSLNGFGLLSLLGVEGRIKVNLEKAAQYFSLAQEMGSADAMYNLAMMWLGWKTHYKFVEDLEDEGMTTQEELESFLPPKKATYALHYSKRITDKRFKGPTQSELKDAIALLTKAANKGHIQAKHRLGMIYSEGIEIETGALKYGAVKRDCTKARSMYQWVAELANPIRSQRLRKAYKEYVAGNLEVSLRNYLTTAETGSSLAQVNAAFLLEQGTCLGMSRADCSKAAVRLWKAAAARGSMEALLRVGDFYYYGRLRDYQLPAGPFGWLQYVLYPEVHLRPLLSKVQIHIRQRVEAWMNGEPIPLPAAEQQAEEDSDSKPESPEEMREADWATAAHYYLEAVEKYHSPRANFNLAFMYEWGLGVKQDFPLAKRHYDLVASTAASSGGHGGGLHGPILAAEISLMAMSMHQSIIRLQMACANFWDDQSGANEAIDGAASSSGISNSGSPTTSKPPSSGNKRAPSDNRNRKSGKTRQDVLLSHILNWSSVAIAILTIAVFRILSIRSQRQQRRRQQQLQNTGGNGQQ